MTLEEYEYYSNITIKLFNYMNGRVNQLNNKCMLEIDPYDLMNNRYGNIKYPNKIFIYVGNIVDNWEDSWGNIIDKKDYTCSCIAWAISHELHHADQLISMMMYNRNIDYKNKIEQDVERASYEWVRYYATELSKVGGFNCIIDSLQSPTMPDNSNYTKATSKQFYLQTIENIVLRDSDLFRQLQIFTNDSMCEDMILLFNDIDTVVIKSNSKFLDENINNFSNLVYHYCSRYDEYRVFVEVVFSYNHLGRTMATVKISINDAMIHPIQYKFSDERATHSI